MFLEFQGWNLQSPQFPRPKIELMRLIYSHNLCLPPSLCTNPGTRRSPSMHTFFFPLVLGGTLPELCLEKEASPYSAAGLCAPHPQALLDRLVLLSSWGHPVLKLENTCESPATLVPMQSMTQLVWAPGPRLSISSQVMMEAPVLGLEDPSLRNRSRRRCFWESLSPFCRDELVPLKSRK